ncbi:conserved hypothetical protein [Streptomyces himastatinicus ATCC 53653]|uniref:Transposase n=1 Tax=Streptomyces himastatinicus ATCC 53653 TaxID=457427 RepID=D9WIP2_9ACTN|nr:conserved hypothetical protein [Streptomyces himastatinicus ATCC 53653]
MESLNDTFKGQLDLEQHGGRTLEGVAVRVAQRILAMAAAIWRNHKTGADEDLNWAVSVDSTIVRAHQCAAGARKKGPRQANRTTTPSVTRPPSRR